MTKQLFCSFGFLCCFLASNPAHAEAPIGEAYVPRQTEEKVFFANNSKTFQLDRISLSDRPVKLSFPPTIAPKIQETVFLTQSTELRRNTTYRWNLFNSLTLGVGVVDESISVGLAQTSRQEMPLVENDDWRVNLNFQPSSQLGINFNGNYLSSQIGVNWQPIPGLTFTGSRHNQSETLAAGMQLYKKGDGLSFSARANLDTEDRWNWGLSSSLGSLQLSHQSNGNPHGLGTNSQLSYRLFGSDRTSSASLLKVGYETRHSENSDDRLTTFGLRYQSGNRTQEDPSLWEFDVGYGIGSQGRGLITSVSTTLSRNLVLRARYQGVSLTSDSHTFKLELLPFSK